MRSGLSTLVNLSARMHAGRLALGVVRGNAPAAQIDLDQRGLHQVLGVAEITGQAVGEPHERAHPSAYEGVELGIAPAGH